MPNQAKWPNGEIVRCGVSMDGSVVDGGCGENIVYPHPTVETNARRPDHKIAWHAACKEPLTRHVHRSQLDFGRRTSTEML